MGDLGATTYPCAYVSANTCPIIVVCAAGQQRAHDKGVVRFWGYGRAAILHGGGMLLHLRGTSLLWITSRISRLPNNRVWGIVESPQEHSVERSSFFFRAYRMDRCGMERMR